MNSDGRTHQTRLKGAQLSNLINKLTSVIVPFDDQDRALEFYTDALGLEKRVDAPFGEGYRWIEVAPPGGETTIVLSPPGPHTTAGGKDTGISLATTDIEGVHAQLKASGADVDEEISQLGEGVPPLFWLRDPEGNTLMVVQAQ